VPANVKALTDWDGELFNLQRIAFMSVKASMM
jgi:hypothetical protein